MKSRFLCYLFISAILIVKSLSISSQFEKVTWDYPVKPGTEKWNQLKDESERLSVLQIPDSILNVIETEELVIACLNYPVAFDYTAYDDEHTGLKKVISNFNGLQELFDRNDAGKYLIEHYENAGVNGFIIKDKRLNERYWPFKFLYIELLLSQKEIIQKLEVEDRLLLLETTLNKFNLKNQNKDMFSKYDNINSALIIARIMASNNVEEVVSDSVYMKFASDRELSDYETVEKIIELGGKYIETLKSL